MTEVGNDIRAHVSSSLRGFMQQLAGADSTFTFAGTFGVIIPAGTVVGALLERTYDDSSVRVRDGVDSYLIEDARS